MNRFLLSAALVAPALVHAGADARQWAQTATIAAEPGKLTLLDLPDAVLDAARPGLADLRLFDATGREIPFLIERPQPRAAVKGDYTAAPKSFRAELAGSETHLFLEPAKPDILTRLELETPAAAFMKAVRVEASADGETWTTLVAAQPIFRQRDGAQNLVIPLPKGVRGRLRVVIDDARSDAVPFTGAKLGFADAVIAPGGDPRRVVSSAKTLAREESAGTTRLTLDLGAANLPLAAITLSPGESLFRRRVRAVYPEQTETGPREIVVAEGVLFRAPATDAGVPERLTLVPQPDAEIPGRRLTLVIENGDNPPLDAPVVTIERRPRRLVFTAPVDGAARLAVGHDFIVAPEYDLAALKPALREAAPAPATLGDLHPTPGYIAPKPDLPPYVAGAPLDASRWTHRRVLTVTPGGLYRVAPDSAVLARCRADFGDLRLESGGNQVPFLAAPASAPVAIEVALRDWPADPKRPGVSRRRLEFPPGAAAVSELRLETATPVFARSLRLLREETTPRDGRREVEVYRGEWRRTADRASDDRVPLPAGVTLGQTLILEVEDGENAALPIVRATLAVPVPALTFLAPPVPGEVSLRYGNPDATAPAYADFRLGAVKLSRVKPQTAPPGPEEGRDASRGGSVPAGWLFGGALALVVATLLWVLRRLLPAADSPA